VSSTTAKYNTGQQIVLKSGQSAKIVGNDPVNQTYQVIGSDNKVLTVKPDEIEKAEKSKYSDYRISGTDTDNQEELAIKKTEFTPDQFG
jgi:hypothetical protein